MHELSIASSVLEAVRTEMGRRPGARLLKVGLRVGALSGVEPEALRFSFEAIVHATDLESARLEIESCPRRQRCPQCGRDFAVVDFDLRCPSCGASDTELIGGDELTIAYLELEEP
jgi:hydrogenase nickel incorporation protein HypA/HybF